jgi:hypothetical protein
MKLYAFEDDVYRVFSSVTYLYLWNKHSLYIIPYMWNC